MRKIFPIVLDYCGGSATDALYEALSDWNPAWRLHLLDNGSPRDSSKYATHTNARNTYIGGGIRDCVSLAEGNGAEYVLIIMADVRAETPIRFDRFADAVETIPEVVQISGSFTEDSVQSRLYPWMSTRSAGLRREPHADILCCAVNISFVRSWNGFPASVGGWGYDYEIAYWAERRRAPIILIDDVVLSHTIDAPTMQLEDGTVVDKGEEMTFVYPPHYLAELMRLVKCLKGLR